LGVDPTDTVVYYETPAGKICVHPSNRVAIYAPRFGVVRQVTGAFSAENTLSPNRILAPVSPLGLEEQEQVSGVTDGYWSYRSKADGANWIGCTTSGIQFAWLRSFHRRLSAMRYPR
jgi:hypothetical protein